MFRWLGLALMLSGVGLASRERNPTTKGRKEDQEAKRKEKSKAAGCLAVVRKRELRLLSERGRSRSGVSPSFEAETLPRSDPRQGILSVAGHPANLKCEEWRERVYGRRRRSVRTEELCAELVLHKASIYWGRQPCVTELTGRSARQCSWSRGRALGQRTRRDARCSQITSNRGICRGKNGGCAIRAKWPRFKVALG